MDKVEQAVIDLGGEWPSDKLTPGMIFCDGHLVSRPEFMEARKRLESKPSWDSHSWDQIFFFDGAWFGARDGWSLEDHTSDGWKGRGVDLLREDGRFLCHGRYFGDWTKSLERRPESKPELVGLDLAKGSDSSEAFMMAMKSKWDGKGFPPPGSELEWRDCGGTWHEARCIGFDGPACVLAVDGEGYKGECHITNLRPIRSHKERAIEAADRALGSRFTPDFQEDIFGGLYEAGMLKLPEDSQ